MWNWRDLFQISFGSLASVILLAIGAGFAVYLMLPDDEQRVSALVRDGKPSAALELLERRQAMGQFTSSDAFEQSQLYLGLGEPERATELLEGYWLADNSAAWALRELARIYRYSSNVDAEISALQRLLELGPTVEEYRRLLGLYRLYGREAEEQALINARRAKGLASPQDLERLAILLASTGKMDEAAGILGDLDSEWNAEVVEPRLLLIHLLADLGKKDELSQRLEAWGKQAPDKSGMFDVAARDALDAAAKAAK